LRPSASPSPSTRRCPSSSHDARDNVALYPRYRGGRPPTFTLAQRQQIKKLALSRPQDHDLPFSTWSLAKLADFLVAEGVVEDISHEGLRVLLDEAGVSFHRLKDLEAVTRP
jgi:transposase